MPRFNPTPDAIKSSFETLPKDRYTFRVGEPKPAEQSKGENKPKVFGVRYPLTVISGVESGEEHKDKKASFFVEMFNEDGSVSPFAGFGKYFLLAARGYIPRDSEQEKAFNAETQSEDWGFDPDTNYVGDFWQSLNGNLVDCEVDVQAGRGDKSDVLYQKFASWSPVGK